MDIELSPIGTVESPLTDRATAPKQGDEGAPEAWLVLRAEVAEGLDGIQPGDEVIVLTWLDRARRDVLRVHPRGDLTRAEQGVFNTRSPDRPNPIGLHVVEVVSIDATRVRVRNLEALDGTPVLDLKPVLAASRSASRWRSSGSCSPAARPTAAEMARFAADVLGLEPAPTGGVSADMFALPDGAFFAVAGPREMGDTSRTIGFLVADLAAAVAELRAAGVEVDEPAENDRHRYVHFRAPDGKLYELVEER